MVRRIELKPCPRARGSSGVPNLAIALGYFQHRSQANDCDMRFAVYTPPQAAIANTHQTLPRLSDLLRLGDAGLKALLNDWLEGVYTAADIDWFVPHQANKRIIDGAGNDIEGIPIKDVFVRGFLPAKFLGIHVIRKLNHGNAHNHRLE